MKQGMTLAKLVELLDFQQEHKRDFIVGTEAMTVFVDTHKDATSGFGLEFFETNNRKPRTFTYRLTQHCLTQIAQHCSVPMRLIETMRKGTDVERNQVAELLTVRLEENPESRLVRTLAVGNNLENPNGLVARAFLSDRYRTLDNYELVQAIFPILQKMKGKLKIESCDLTETHLYIKLKYPNTNGSLGKVRDEGGMQVDDIVEAGVLITNSEVGAGYVKIQPYLRRCICANGATVSMAWKGTKKIHLGPKATAATVKLGKHLQSDKEFFDQVALTIGEIVKDEKFFDRVIKMFKETKKHKISEPEAAVKALVKQFKLTPEEGDRIWNEMKRVSGRSRFDLVNAVTRVAGRQGKAITYARAVELERVGGLLIEMPYTDWCKIGFAKTDDKGAFDLI